LPPARASANINCLPSKNEIWSAKVADLVHHAASFGAMMGSVAIDMAKVRQRKRGMVEDMIAVTLQQYKESGAELIIGTGTFVALKTLEVRLNGGAPTPRRCRSNPEGALYPRPVWCIRAMLLKRPVGRPSNDVRRSYASFTYQAGSWSKPRRVIAKVEWHPGELYPRVGFIVTNMSRPAENVVAYYNKRGTCEQWIKEGKGAINWTRLSCRSFAANAVGLQLHALAYNLGNFLRTLATPEPIKDWSMTPLKEKLIKIGAKVVICGRPSMASTFLALRTIWLAAVICPASVGAEHMSAGPDEVRRPGSLSATRAFC
jgi:Transposase DDE domain group 1